MSQDPHFSVTAFMTGLVMPDDIFWVNLNPWEPGRIIDEQLGQNRGRKDHARCRPPDEEDFSRYGNPCENETRQRAIQLAKCENGKP